MRDTFVSTLTNLAEKDSDVLLLTADLGFGIFDQFSNRFPKQFINVGVAEQSLIGVSFGLAREGFTVFAYTISNFGTFRCLEQIRNGPCYHQANVNIVTSGAGFSYGPLGYTHHGIEDIAIMRSLPGMTVVSPANSNEAHGATIQLANSSGPSYLRLERGTEKSLLGIQQNFKLGKASTIRDGKDVTIIATGGILEEVINAAEILRKQKIHCRIISMHTIKPVDQHAIISAVKDTGKIITVEEGTLEGGLGSAVAECILDYGLTPNVFARIGLPSEIFSVIGSQQFLRKKFGLDALAISNKVLQLLHKKEERAG